MIDSLVPIRWKLKEVLDQNGVTPHALAKHVGIEPPNMYRLLRGDGPKTFDRETLSRLVRGLREITGDKRINVHDLLEETK